ncbi:MAG: helix-turn-helix transcriptional regulator [Polyangiaceae bacterium]
MRRVREERGLTTAALAAKIEVTEDQVLAWEGGVGVAPYETMLKIASALGTTPNALIFGA